MFNRSTLLAALFVVALLAVSAQKHSTDRASGQTATVNPGNVLEVRQVSKPAPKHMAAGDHEDGCDEGFRQGQHEERYEQAEDDACDAADDADDCD